MAAHTTNTFAFDFAAYSFTLATYSFEAPSSARSSSATFAAKITGIYVISPSDFTNATSSSSEDV